jgi:uncharacterized protein (UPF0333 family)
MDKDKTLILLFVIILLVAGMMMYTLKLDEESKQLKEYHEFKLDSLKLVKTGIVDECK